MIRRRLFSATALTSMVGFVFASAGCDNAPHNNGPDMGFLTTSLSANDSPIIQSKNLLPLTTGNNWQMLSATRGQRFNDALKVTGPSTIPGVKGIEISLTREGKPWRREFYRQDASGIYMPAMQDETSPVMVLDPPLPLVKYPFHEGESQVWHGLFVVKGSQLPASAFSRVSAIESLHTSAGEFRTARIDTMITLNVNGRDLRFPSVRWLAPDVGFVRRGFADKGQPAFSETTKFNVH